MFTDLTDHLKNFENMKIAVIDQQKPKQKTLDPLQAFLGRLGSPTSSALLPKPVQTASALSNSQTNSAFKTPNKPVVSEKRVEST